MKTLERMIDTMRDDLKDSYMLVKKARDAHSDDNKEEKELYLNRAKERLEMFDKDVSNIKSIMANWENKVYNEIGTEHKERFDMLKKIYCKFFEHDIASAEMLRREIAEMKSAY